MFCDLGGEICPRTEKPNRTLTINRRALHLPGTPLSLALRRAGGASQRVSLASSARSP